MLEEDSGREFSECADSMLTIVPRGMRNIDNIRVMVNGETYWYCWQYKRITTNLEIKIIENLKF